MYTNIVSIKNLYKIVSEFHIWMCNKHSSFSCLNSEIQTNHVPKSKKKLS
jgi:hypothetical protein